MNQPELSEKSIAIVYGTPLPSAGPDEQDVLVQAREVSQVLAKSGYSVLTIAADLDLASLAQKLTKKNVSTVFNLVESLGGQDRLMPVAPYLYESLNLPYTGVSAAAIAATTHKGVSKQIMLKAGIPTPCWFNCAQWPGIRAPAGAYIVKSVHDHASQGLDDLQVFASAAEASVYLRSLPSNQLSSLMAEQFIDGREFNIAMLDTINGPVMLPAAEMHFVDFPANKPRIVGYRAKWDPTAFEYTHTVRSFDFPDKDGALITSLESITLACRELFSLRGYFRVDFRVDCRANPWVLEINANPCLSPDAGFAAAADRSGIDYDSLINHIVNTAKEGA